MVEIRKPWIANITLARPDSDTGDLHLKNLIAALSEGGFAKSADMLNANRQFHGFLGTVFSLSPYLADCTLRNPEGFDDLIRFGFDKHCRTIIRRTRKLGRKTGDENNLMAELRRMKSSIALACGLADLGGWWEGEMVTGTLSKFADACLGAALDFILKDAATRDAFTLADKTVPQKDSGLIVLAMGKLGAHELNYSSDIDLILFYTERAASRVKKSDPTTFFAKVAKQLVRILQERTADGYVFRVDLRLRPDPSSTPPVMPVEAALVYYESHGQNWERAALIKARPAAGDLKAGALLLTELNPFIWRKYLDYAAIQDVHSIKRQIHAHKGHAEIATRGHNIKLGRGGIREIEFFAQTQQLIAGGRNEKLRTLGTIQTLDTLCQHGWISRPTASQLTNAYWILRNVEHRLQMVRDEQTHTLPDDEAEFTNIAIMMGHQTAEQFTAQLTTTLRQVEKHYASLFEASEQLTATSGNLVFTGDEEDPHTLETLMMMGFKRPRDIVRTIRGWHFARYPALRTSQARELLTELTPGLLRAFADTGRADETLIAMDRFISGLPAGIQLFALLNSNPPLLRLLTLLLSAAPRLAQIITRRPHVFDGLLDPAFNQTPPDKEEFALRLRQVLGLVLGYERLLDQARIFAAEQKFLIGVRILNATINAPRAAIAFSNLAEVMIREVLDVVRAEFENKHGSVAGGKICILAMGRLGSDELSAGSDLDLIFLYDHDKNADVSDGKKPLPVSQYFTRLTQRLIAAMSAPTAEGVIYELDFRLRPSGNAGPLAAHINSFLKYQRENAWTWERQALTRARPVAGDEQLGTYVAKEISHLILSAANAKNLNSDIADMRARIDREKASDNPWNVKSARGGLTDVEFIAQWLVLSQTKPPRHKATNTRTILKAASDTMLSQSQCEHLLSAHELYTTVSQIISTCLEDEFDPADAPKGLEDILCAETGQPDIPTATALLASHQTTVREIFNRLME